MIQIHQYSHRSLQHTQITKFKVTNEYPMNRVVFKS